MGANAIPGPMKLFKRKDSKDANFYVKFMVRGKQYLWSTKTSVEPVAKVRAKKYREDIIAEAYHMADLSTSRRIAPTFHKLFLQYRLLPLKANKVSKGRAIGAMKAVLEASGMKDDDRLDSLSAKLALTYQQECVKLNENPVTINARLRFSRSLFSSQAMVGYKAFGLAIKPQWVEDYCSVGNLPEPERLPEIPAPEQMALAHARLAPFPDVYRAFLLAAYAGLRAGEIVAAKWDWIEGDVLYVGGRGFVAKNRKWRPIGLAPEVKALLEKGGKGGEFIVGSSPATTVVRRLPQSLRDVGFLSATPVHSLRRLFGSKVAAVSGLWGAQNALGHANPQTTAKHYARQLGLTPAVPMEG